ncbi:MAG: hypothetical protein ABIF71_12905 [Planctomycetota bacterium]
MAAVMVTKKGSKVVVRNEYWTVEHDARTGGGWSSVKFAKGTGKNLLAAPMSWRVRNLDPHPTSDGSSPYFYEAKYDKEAALAVAELPTGAVAVTATGTLRLKDGKPINITYRHRFEYRKWGLVACELELDCPAGRDDIVEVVALELILREGMDTAHVKEHPIRAGNSDILGHGKWYKLGPGEPGYQGRHVPVHVVVFEKGKEGLEFTCQSDLKPWDTGFNADGGMGLFEVHQSWGNPKETLIALAPYCVAYRRNPTAIRGSKKVRYYLGLPFIKDRTTVGAPCFHASTGSHWIQDADLPALRKSGVKLMRFHNDYREDGPFWHDGMYPPFDAKGMAHLKRVVHQSHAAGIKIIPYISVKEFHPETPGCRENQVKWRQQPGPTFPDLHTWAGSGEFGQLMCLESGWLAFRKKSIDIILNDLPWDGLYFDWCTPHACRNPHHFGGACHTDQDAFYDFMFWVRERVGPQGVILSHISGLPQIVVENMSTMALIFEEQNYNAPFPEPGQFPPQCEFMPIIPRQLCADAPAGTPHARRTIMSGILSGTPGIMAAVSAGWDAGLRKATAFSSEMLRETALFGEEDLGSYKFEAATARAVRLKGGDKLYAALWRKPGRALVYVGNFSPKPVKGSFRVDPQVLRLSRPGPLTVTRLMAPGRERSRPVKAGVLKTRGAAVALKPWGAALFRIEPE